MWTVQEGAGRPLSKGTGERLSNPASPLVFPRNFNRISAPDAELLLRMPWAPRMGSGGDIVANVFVLGQRFDFATFDALDGPLPPDRGTNWAGRLGCKTSPMNARVWECSGQDTSKCWLEK